MGPAGRGPRRTRRRAAGAAARGRPSVSRAVARGRRRSGPPGASNASIGAWRPLTSTSPSVDLHRVADELVRLGSDQDLARLGRLLEASCHVHRVPGDQPLAGRRITRHHLAGRDPVRHATVAPPAAPAAASALRGSPRHAPRGSVVLVHARDAEDAIAASPMNFSTTPPCPSTMALTRSNERPSRPRNVSGSSRSPSAVDPTRSQNRTVTVFRVSAAGALASSAAPHEKQNLASAGFSFPQRAQSLPG